ncbi:MAG: hypothetical protein ACRDPR_06230, partial [Nocardioidaceae bacterium]
GVAATLDGALLNGAGTMAVSFTVADGGSFVIFASDYANTEFVPGTKLTLTATFSDGGTATALLTVPVVTSSAPGQPSLTLTYNGKLRDRVGQSNGALGGDGALDGTLTATLKVSGGRTVTGLRLDSSAPGTWDTQAGTGYWVLGVATTVDGELLNDAGSMTVSLPVSDGGSFVIFAADYLNSEFVPGTTLTLVATFSDGTSATATITIPTASTTGG